MNVSYTVSARKSIGVGILRWIETNYYPLDQIDSVFGFAEFTPLYGGRPYHGPELQPIGISKLYDNGIGFRIPLTNHFVSRDEYRQEKKFLDKYHRDGNTIICVNDDLAKWVKEDYPNYRIEASAIKKISTHQKIREALSLYDSVVLPASCNDNLELLQGIEDKNRVRLFARAGCAYTCPSKICYKSFSSHMKNPDTELLCSMQLKERPYKGVIDFDIQPFVDMGFHKFKSVPRG